MPIKTYITTVDSEEVSDLKIDNEETLDILGTREENIAVQLEELFSSVTEAISSSIDVESKLTIEITGSISMKAKGDIKYLFFNAGAETGTTGGMKVVLSTTLKPE
ncbi:MAG: hypothetical protein AAGE84_05815 [Cyanobacteria bacterium P01_G01_bin.39]